MKTQVILNESFRLIGKSKFTFLVAVLLCTTGVLLSTFLLSAYRISFYIESEARQTFKLNVFLSDSATTGEVEEIKKNLRLLDSGAQFHLIDKQEALKNFAQETGEEIQEVMEYNPLPATLVTTLNSSSPAMVSSENLRRRISVLPGVDDMEFKKDILVNILKNVHGFQDSAVWIIGSLSLIIFILIAGAVRNILKIGKEVIKGIMFISPSGGEIKMIITVYLLIVALFGFIISALFFWGVYGSVGLYVGISADEFIPFRVILVGTAVLSLIFCMIGGILGLMRLRSQIERI